MASSQGREPNSTQSRGLSADCNSRAGANDDTNGANGARDATTNQHQHPRPPGVLPASASANASVNSMQGNSTTTYPINGPQSSSSSSSSGPSNTNFNPRRVSRESAGAAYTYTQSQVQAQAQRTQHLDPPFFSHNVPFVPSRNSQSASGTEPNRPASHRRSSGISSFPPPVQGPATPESEHRQRRAWSRSPYLYGSTPGSPGFRALSPIREGFREDTFPTHFAPPPRRGRGGYSGVSQQPRARAGSNPHIPPALPLYPNSRYPRIGNSRTHDDLEERLRRHNAEAQDPPRSRIPVPSRFRARPRSTPASASSTPTSGSAGPSGSQRPSSGSSSDSVSLRGGGYDHHLSITHSRGSRDHRRHRDRGRSESRAPPRRYRNREPSPPRRRQQSGASDAQSNRQPHVANTVGSNYPEAPDAAASNLSAPKEPTTGSRKEAYSKNERSNEEDIELKGEHPKEPPNDEKYKVKDQPKEATVEMTPRVGPHPGHIKVSRQYYFEYSIRRKLSKPGVDPSREEEMRLRGVQNIQELKQELRLPAKTYNAACVFYHRFRLKHIGAQHNWRDASTACLFLACKTEDTLKKSKEILCSSYNMKNADKKTPDDKYFESQHKVIVGLERLVIEAIHFDFRVRNPQEILAKVVKSILPAKEDRDKFFPAAYQISLDMYKTYAPIKQTSHTMALAVCEVTALLTDTFTERFCGLDAAAYHTERASVTETILDILDLYEKHRGFSELARQFPADTFIELKIVINRELEEKGLPRYKFQCAPCEKDPDPASDSEDPDFLRAAAAAARPGDVPTRYVFDTEAAVAELEAVRGYFVDDFEVVEVEEEEEVRDSPPPPAAREHQPRGPRGPRGSGGGGRGRRGGGAGGPPRGPGGGPPRGPNGPPRDGGGRDHGGAGGRGGHGGNWRSRNRHGNRRRRD